MIQPVNSYTVSPETQGAESFPQPAQSFQEVLLNQISSDEKNAGNSSTITAKSQTAESLSQPEQSFRKVLPNQISSDEKNPGNSSTVTPESQTAESQDQPTPSPEGVLQEQPVSEAKNEGMNKEAQPKKVAATLLLNLLPILPNLCDGSNLIKVDPSQVQSLAQSLSQPASMIPNQPALSILSLAGKAENPEPNPVPFTMTQTKSDSSAPAISLRQHILSILNVQENELQAGPLSKIVRIHSSESNPQVLNQGTSADPKTIGEEGATWLLDNRSDPSSGKIPIQSQFPGGPVQGKETFPQTQLIPNLFLKQKETTTAPSSDFVNELPEGEKNPIFATGTTSQNTPWAMGNEAIKNSSFKSESNADLLGQKITTPGVSTDSPRPLEFDEKLPFLLGQNSTGGELPGQSLKGEFSDLGNSSAEKDNPKAISGGENQPTQDPFDVNGLLGGPKPTTVVQETNSPQNPELSKAGQVDPYQQVADKVVWSIQNNEERIQLTLEPPQLGNLFIELQREKEGIKATLWADNPKTKEILENNQPQLQKTLEEHGFKLEKYDVFLKNDMASFQGKEEKSIFHGQGSREKSLQIHKAELDPSLEILPAAIPVAGGSQYIDRFI
jgi:flagellar hook-length control protein FliK